MKWGGAAATLLLLVVWLGSGWWMINWCVSTRVEYGLAAGEFWVGWWAGDPGRFTPGAFHIGRYDGGGYHLQWWDWGRSVPPVHVYAIPLWVPLLPCAVVTAVAWRLDTRARRRARVGLCPHCGYDRAGLTTDAVCPECGKGP